MIGEAAWLPDPWAHDPEYTSEGDAPAEHRRLE
jgi:hypothetical protein